MIDEQEVSIEEVHVLGRHRDVKSSRQPRTVNGVETPTAFA